MASSFSGSCSNLKKKYDDCFNSWYSDEFLQGKGRMTNPCHEVFQQYRSCLEAAIKEKGMGKMLEEARKENPFSKDGKR
jgi:TRIAP1/MDM35 family protein